MSFGKPALRGAVGHRPSLLILEKYRQSAEVRDRTAQFWRYQPDGIRRDVPAGLLTYASSARWRSALP